jgi:hypothetical protein
MIDFAAVPIEPDALNAHVAERGRCLYHVTRAYRPAATEACPRATTSSAPVMGASTYSTSPRFPSWTSMGRGRHSAST